MMTSKDNLSAIKKRVSSAVLRLPGVAGVGVPADGVTIYLESDAADVRCRVADAIERLELPVEVHLNVSGKFVKHEGR